MRPVLAALAVFLAAAPAFADQTSALAAVRSQPKALDASIDDKGNLYVVVKDERAVSWPQYATIMCQIVRPHQARVFQAHVVDLTSVGRGTKPVQWKKLASVSCDAK